MRPSITLVNRGIRSPESDPQCPCLLERIDELDAALALETEPARARHWRWQLRAVVDRARGLGCLGCTPQARPVRDSSIP
jgi:hypothetical protein